MKQISRVCILLALFSAMSVAQTPPQTPKPSPELKKQDFFVGTWTLEGETKATPFRSWWAKIQIHRESGMDARRVLSAGSLIRRWETG
jgi:hypothetical protein